MKNEYPYLNGGYAAEQLRHLEELERQAALRSVNVSELEPIDKQDIWNWYFNQRGGSCNGS